MTLLEAQDLAARGDVGAMMALANYYSKDTSNEDSIDIAFEYYQQAAEAGEPTAISMMAETSYRTASNMLLLLEQFGRDDDAIRSIEDAHKWTQKLVQTMDELGIHGDAANSANDLYIDSIVWLSSIYCLDNNFSSMKRITEDVSHPIAQALYGRALYELAGPNDEMETAFRFMRSAMHYSFWADKYSKPKFLEILRTTTGSILSSMYRVLYQDIDAAYNVTEMMLRNTKDPDLRSALQEDISCYKKTIFGGYKYIG
ncbi:MAG: hypothetical protein ACI4PO_00955 [Faecousia sp.]